MTSIYTLISYLFPRFSSSLRGPEGIGLEGYAFGCAGLGVETARTGGIWGAGFFTEACDRQGNKKEKGQIGADWKREGGFLMNLFRFWLFFLFGLFCLFYCLCLFYRLCFLYRFRRFYRFRAGFYHLDNGVVELYSSLVCND